MNIIQADTRDILRLGSMRSTAALRLSAALATDECEYQVVRSPAKPILTPGCPYTNQPTPGRNETESGSRSLGRESLHKSVCYTARRFKTPRAGHWARSRRLGQGELDSTTEHQINVAETNQRNKHDFHDSRHDITTGIATDGSSH